MRKTPTTSQDILPTKAGFIAILGLTNAGKSTLLNQLIGEKVSIISHKVQTTRQRILGLHIQDQSQFIFVDTPGIFTPQRRLDRAMISAAFQCGQEADINLVVCDVSSRKGRNIQAMLQKIDFNKPTFLVLNKIDKILRSELPAIIYDLTSTNAFEGVFLISAHTGDGCSEILKRLEAFLPESPWLYPADQITDLSQRVWAAEITREAVYEYLHKELPYWIAVQTEKFERKDTGAYVISQVILVARDNHKGIVLGNKGQSIKRIGTKARLEISKNLHAPVHLDLHVKVDPKWIDRADLYEDMGLDFNS